MLKMAKFSVLTKIGFFFQKNSNGILIEAKYGSKFREGGVFREKVKCILAKNGCFRVKSRVRFFFILNSFSTQIDDEQQRGAVNF